MSLGGAHAAAAAASIGWRASAASTADDASWWTGAHTSHVSPPLPPGSASGSQPKKNEEMARMMHEVVAKRAFGIMCPRNASEVPESRWHAVCKYLGASGTSAAGLSAPKRDS